MALKKKSGFTLIEMLIVVAIIATLASVVLVGLGPTRRLGRDARRISDLRQIQNGLELYFNKCSYYPGGSASLCNGPAPADFAGLSVALAPLGINNIPNDPSAGKTYLYGVKADGTSYTLGAQLEDTGNSALNQSVDGDSNGIKCSRVTGLYCVQL